MQRPDFNQIVETALASLGGSPTSSDVEAAAIRLVESNLGASDLAPGAVLSAQCSISLAACSSRRSSTQRARVYDHVKKSADTFSEAIRNASREAAFQFMPRIMVSLRDCTNLFAGHGPEELLNVSEAISQAAQDASVEHVLGPFLDLTLSDGFDKVDLIPDCLTRFKNLIPAIQVGTEQDGFNDEMAIAIGYALGIASNQSRDHASRIAIEVNGCNRRAFGRRVSSTAKGISISYRDASSLDAAMQFGLSVASDCTSCYELIQLDNQSYSAGFSGQGSNSTTPAFSRLVDNINLAHTSEGYPQVSGLPNLISITGTIDPIESAALIRNRLLPFCYSNKLAGFVIELLPSS